MRHILISIAMLISVFAVGVVGFHYFEDLNYMDSAYLTVQTITTIGYGDLAPRSFGGRVFSVGFMMAGVGVALYVLSAIMDFIIVGELKEVFFMADAKKKISKMKDHIIVCGYGRVGKEVSDHLEEERVNFVVVENNRLLFEEESRRLFVEGDATTETVLKEAGIKAARAIIATLPDDSQNILITLISKDLNPELQVIARANTANHEEHLYRSGATKVVMPEKIGGAVMVSQLLTPGIYDCINAIVRHGLGIERIHIGEDSPLNGASLKDSDIRERTGATVVAVESTGRYVPNPGPDYRLSAGDSLIVLGNRDQLPRVRELI